MVLLLSLVVYTLGPSVTADPSSLTLLKSRDAPTSETFDTNYRSTTDILWTCMLTIFACTWISVHPNVAGYRSTWRQMFTARLELMLWAVFAPELIVVFAFRQWRGAKTIKREMNDFASRGTSGLGKVPMAWSETHAHFLQMGGFIVRERDGCCHYPDIDSLGRDRDYPDVTTRSRELPYSAPFSDTLSQQSGGGDGFLVVASLPTGFRENWARRSLIPLLNASVPEGDIWDKSKGDAFGKGLALIQTGWFLVQTLARFALRMEVTHLEVTTLAYAALNGVIYWFWWQKPLDVQCPIVIDADLGGHQNLCSSCKQAHAKPPSPLQPVYIGGQGNYSMTSVSSGSALSMPQRRVTMWRKVRSRTFWASEAPKIFLRPLKACISRLRTVVEYRKGKRENRVPTSSTRFPMFYALPLSTNWQHGPRDRATLPPDHSATQLMGLALASAFGAIHCVGWNFQFDYESPTPLPLRTLWRVSSLCITASPGPLLVLFLIAYLHQWPRRRPLLRLEMRILHSVLWLRAVGQVVVFLYIPARLILIVLAFYDLTSLTPSAHRTVEWASFIPHFG